MQEMNTRLMTEVENFKPKNANSSEQIKYSTYAYEEVCDETAKPQEKPSVAELLVNAETLLKYDEKELARGLISRALAIDSKNIVALKKLSGTLTSQNEADLKIKVQKEICKQESSFQTMSDLAHLYYKSGQDKQALELYYEALNIVIDEEEELFEIYKNVGNILTRDADFDGAEEYFNKAFCLKPSSDQLAVNLGTLAIQQQDYAKALERFRGAVELNSRNDKAWVGLALVHNQMGDHELAFGNIEKAIDLNMKNRTAVHLFANWAIRDGKYQAAAEVVEEYLSFVDLDEEMSFVLVHLFCQLNQFDFAQLEIERVLLWNPMSSSAAQLEQELRKLKRK